MENFLAAVLQRESCRNFDPDRRIKRDILEHIMESAHFAPSACNSQPWHFTVVSENEDAINDMIKSVQYMGRNTFASNCHAFIVINEEPITLPCSLASEFGNDAFVKYDIGIAVSHICYAAQALDISSCILGCFDEKKVHDIVGTDASKKIPLIIALGYPATDTLRPKIRKELSEIVDYI